MQELWCLTVSKYMLATSDYLHDLQEKAFHVERRDHMDDDLHQFGLGSIEDPY
jgi:hypothetical protein